MRLSSVLAAADAVESPAPSSSEELAESVEQPDECLDENRQSTAVARVAAAHSSPLINDAIVKRSVTVEATTHLGVGG